MSASGMDHGVERYRDGVTGRIALSTPLGLAVAVSLVLALIALGALLIVAFR